MKKLLFLILLLFPSLAFAQPAGKGFVSLSEEDGSPQCFGWQIKSSNGSITDNGDGTCSISAGGTPAGSDTQVQYNNAGAFGASAALTFAGNKLQVARTAAAASPADSAIYSVYAYPMATNDIAAGYYSILSNTGTNAAGTGHGIAYLGNAGDAVGSLFPMYGIEGRATVQGQAPLYVGALGLTAWQGTTPATNSILAGVQGRVEITTDGTTENNAGTNVTAAQFYAPAVIGGTSKYSFYGIDALRVNNYLYAYDATAAHYNRIYHDGTNAYMGTDFGHISLLPAVGSYVIVGQGSGLIPLTEGIALGANGFRWAVSGTTGNFNSTLSSTSLSTSAATPLLMTNGQLVNVALTSQTVGATTLTIPDFASVVDEFTFKTKAQTLSNKTFVAPVLGAATATSITINSGTVMSANSFAQNTGNTTGSAFSSTTNTFWTTGAIFNGATSGSNYTGTGGLLRMTYSGTNSGVVAVFNTSNASASGDTFRIFNIGSGNTTKFGYDTSNYYTSNITSTGSVTFDAVGSGSKFTFSDAVQASDYYSGDGTQGITDSTSYWLCTSALCATTCQVTIKDGLIVGCP